jgi:hypothetical protein
MELHLDSLTGLLVGTCEVGGTGGRQSWATKSCDVNGANGVHDLYLKFTGGSGERFCFNWWKFTPVSVKSSGGEVAGTTLIPRFTTRGVFGRCNRFRRGCMCAGPRLTVGSSGSEGLSQENNRGQRENHPCPERLRAMRYGFSSVPGKGTSAQFVVETGKK